MLLRPPLAARALLHQGPALLDRVRAARATCQPEQAVGAARYELWILAALCALAYALRLHSLVFQSLWRDEVDSIRFAGQALPELLKAFGSAGQNGPLYFLVLRPWLTVAGQHEFGLRMFSVLFGVLAVPLTYRVAKWLFPGQHGHGLTAALLVSTSPYLVWYSQEGKMYAAVVCVILLSFDRLMAAMRRGGWQRWLSYIVVTSAGFYLHLTSVLVVPAEVLAFVLLGGLRHAHARRGFATSLAALSLPYVPLVIWEVPLLSASTQTGYPFVPLPTMIVSLLETYSFGVLPRTPWWAVALVMMLLAAGLLVKGKRSCRSGRLVLLSWLTVPTAAFYLITICRPIFTARYLILVVPALLLLLAVGIVEIGQRSRALAILAAAGLLVANGRGLYIQGRTAQKADFRSATRYVVQQLEPADLLLFQIPYGRFSFDYYFARYTPRPHILTAPGSYRIFLPLVAGGHRYYRWADGLYTNAGMRPEDAAQRMEALVRGSRVVWYLESEADMWDERGLVRDWLQSNTTLTEEAHFVGVTVSRYELPKD